ncbi:hypothetical protein CPT_Machias_004 [Staphylococcus phage Machias]|nr:hypothetical protein CPT_Machias_004 [Staphylococcus phage Machias]
MNKRQRKKLEKEIKLENSNNEKIIDLPKNNIKKDDSKMTKKQTTTKGTPKLTKEQVHFIAGLIDKGHGNTYILKEFKEKYGIERKTHTITHIRRAEYFGHLTEDYRFAKEGYPTFNEYKKILRGDDVKPSKVELAVETVVESPTVEKTKEAAEGLKNKTEEKAKDIKSKMQNVQKDPETGKEYRDNVDIKKAGKQESIFDKIVRKIINLL